MKRLILSVLVLGLVGCGHHHSSNNTQVPAVQPPVVVAPTKPDYPAIPAYPGNVNSTGQLAVTCKNDIIYYTLSYACLHPDVRLSTKIGGKNVLPDEHQRTGGPRYVYHESGHFERNGATTPVAINGTVQGGNPYHGTPKGTYHFNKVCPETK